MAKRVGERLGFSATNVAFGGVFDLTSQEYLKRNNNWTAGPDAILVGGTTATPGNGYSYRTFTSSDSLVVTQPVTVDILIIAGGGGGGPGSAVPVNGHGGGGGGAGGVVYFPNYSLSTGTYSIAVGAGSPGTNLNGNPSYVNNPGGPTLGIAYGGGYGEPSDPSFIPFTANPGGSGGGTCPGPTSATAGSATQPGAPNTGGINYGNNGAGGPSWVIGRGGGGASPGFVPKAVPSPVSGNDGGGGGFGINIATGSFNGPLIGVPSLAPLGGKLAGGGAGGGGQNPSGAGWGGDAEAGGGAGGNFNANGSNGQANSGGGGGGAGGSTVLRPGGQGGSGIVVFRFAV